MTTNHRLSILALAACLCAANGAGAAEARNIIFFLGDGMGPATITAARIYRHKEEGLLNFERLERTARIKTYSNNAQTTDSAPSMGAYMTGIKINNDVISMSSDTMPHKPARDANGNGTVDTCPAGNGRAAATILELAKAAGKSVGAVTTTEMTHATPASTYAHACHRGMGYAIAAQAVPGGAGYNRALGDGVDVLMGGGRHHFTPFDKAANPTGRADGRNLLHEFAARGYTVATTREAMHGAPAGRKLVGIYSADSHLEFEAARSAQPPMGEGASQPSLSDMAAKAIDLLAANPKGFFLMVEGGKIDHGLHGSNARAALGDTIAFDDAVQTALDKMRAIDPGLEHTLIVVTADHDHTMVINGYGKRGNPILDINRSYVDGQPARDADGKTYTTLVFGNGPNRPALRADVASEVVQGALYQQEGGVRLAGETHGGGDVKLFAVGAGSQAFKGTMENTKVFHLMKAAAGL